MTWGRLDPILMVASVLAVAVPTAVAFSDPGNATDGFPSPRIGDSVIYDVAGRMEPVAFLGLETVRTAHGDARQAWRLQDSSSLWWVDPTGPEPILVGRDETERGTQDVLLRSQTTLRRDVDRGAPTQPIPCLLVASRFLGNGIHLPPCSLEAAHWPGGTLALERTTWGAVSEGLVDGIHVRIDHDRDNPYPNRVQVADVTATRVAFLGGVDASAAVAPKSPAPALALAGRTPWGLEEAGVTLLWPLADAYARALTDPLWPDLREWLAEHEGVPVAASFDDSEVQERRQHVWRLTLADGTDRFSLTMRKDLPGGWNVPRVDLGARVTFSSSTSEGPELAVPDQWPRLVSAVAVAAAHLPADFADLPADRYSYEVRGDGTWSLVVGHDRPSRVDHLARSIEGELLRGSLWKVELTGAGHVAHVVAQREFVGPTDQAPPAAEAVGWPTSTVTGSDPRPAWKAAATAGGVAALAVAAAWGVRFLAPLYSRVIGPAVANHPVRARLLEVVASEPGIHRAELARRLDVDGRAIDHHLRVLARAALVVPRRSGRYVVVYPANTPAPPVPDVLRMPTARRILDQVGATPGIQQGDAARRLGLAASTMHHHVARLTAAGLLRGARQGREVRLFVRS